MVGHGHEAGLASAVFPALAVAGCSTIPRVSLPKNIPPADPRLIVHVLNRTGYGPRPGDVARFASIGIDRYLDDQLHPELMPDAAATAQLAALGSLRLTPAAFATTYYWPMVAARQEWERGWRRWRWLFGLLDEL
jgi:hypothetical protein